MRIYLSLLLVTSTLAQQQQPPPQQQEPFVLRSTTRLVMVNIVAVDKKGSPVADLKASEFQITENGKPQKLATFELLNASQAVAPKPPKIQNIFSNKTEQAGVTVILLDYLNTPWADLLRARRQVIDFLSTIHPEDRVAIFSLGNKLRVLHDLTTDTSELIAKLKSSRVELTRNHESTITAPQLAQPDEVRLDPFAAVDSAPTPASALEVEMLTSDRVIATLHSMEAIATHVAGVPGRKSLIWISGSFPAVVGITDMQKLGLAAAGRSYGDEIYRATRALNHAGVAVYPVDARGLMTNPALNADGAGNLQQNGRSSAWLPPNLESMNELASRTGGKAFYNRNDLDTAIRQITDEGRVTYTLGYYPFDAADEKYRNIKVAVTRPGVAIRHRKGYYPTAARKLTESNIKRDIAQAVWSPVDSTTISLDARVDHNPKTGALDIYVQVDPANISLDPQGDRWLAHVDFAFVQKTAEAATRDSVSDTVQLKLTEDRVKTLYQTGLLYKKSIPRRPDAVSMRVIVRDRGTGNTGTLSVPLKEVVSITP